MHSKTVEKCQFTSVHIKFIHEMIAMPKRNLLSEQNITRSMTALGLPINRHES